ncbi:MAG: DUF4159 domain-containing protein [Ignavibacteriaceae bacterium]|nr:DUF4159 domain-containing protein [Ignavibacteriaceae bacterium]
MKNKFPILLLLLFFNTGCDSVYKYVFLPPERIEYTLVPDKDAMEALQDSNYFVSQNGQVVGFDARTWKIEIRYMSDYQLNQFEFPDDSKSAELSGNPYTYANWIDPALGYTPRRFSVFKVTIYNYTSSKLNFDPELAILQTDRGDNFNAYAREQKNARFISIEEYFKKRKGTSGVDEEVFETRMGIARRTMLYYGKPIYKGDSRDGLIVFDPVIDKVEKLKININQFITGYDENNEPSDFIDLVFFFRQVPLNKESLKKNDVISAIADTIINKDAKDLSGDFRFAQLKYIDDVRTSVLTRNRLPEIKDVWNPNPKGITSLIDYIQANSKLKTLLTQVTPDELNKKNYDLLLITGVAASPMIDDNISSLAEFIEKGGFIVFDISTFKDGTVTSAFRHFQSLSEQLKGNVRIDQVNYDHPIFNISKKINGVPLGYESVNGNIEAGQMRGIFLDGKLVALETGRSYSMLWSDNSQSQALNLALNLAVYSISNRKK